MKSVLVTISLSIILIGCEGYIDFSLNNFNESEKIDPKVQNIIEMCPPNKLVNNFLTILTPEDYDQVKSSDIYKRVENINQTIEKIERLQNFSQNISKSFEQIVNRLSARISELMMEIELPTDCMTALVRIATGIQEKKYWALKFLEAIPAPNSGLQDYNKPFIGYDECLEFEIPGYELDYKQEIRGQYCWLGIPDVLPDVDQYKRDPLNDTVVEYIDQYLKNSSMSGVTDQSRFGRPGFTKNSFYETIVLNTYRKTFFTKLPIGICIPNTCSAQDIEYVINKAIYPIVRYSVVVNTDCDYINKPLKLNGYQWTSLSILSCLVILVLISTLYEFFEIKFNKNSDKKSVLKYFGQSFSAISNFKTIYSTEDKNQRFQILDGVRTILSLWVLVCHEHFLDFLPINSKRTDSSVSIGLLYSKKYTLHKNGNFMETFFFIGGMMTSYVMLSKLERSKGKFDYIQYAVFRYMRVMPITLGAILLIFIYPLIGSGPNWDTATNILYVPCRDNWLSSILMTNNIDIVFPTKYICNTAGWYISADYHLYLLAPIVFLIYYKFKNLALIWTLIMLVLATIIGLIPSVVFNIPHFYESPDVGSIYSMAGSFGVYYWRSDAHIVSYVFGMFCGYLIRQKPNLYLGGRYGELFIWISTAVLTSGTMYWNNDFLDFYRPLTKKEIWMFLGFSKLTYLSGWFWLFYACATGRGGFVNRFFSWKGFRSTSNLSFEVCILHVMVILYRVGMARDSVIYTAYYCWTITCFDYLVTYLVSIVFYLLISAPFANLVNFFLKPKQNLNKQIN